jgi:hypothetical protein
MTQGPINREVAFAGLQVRRKVIFALTLCSLLPLMLLTYAFSAPVRELRAWPTRSASRPSWYSPRS